MTFTRADGRAPDQLRPVRITRNYLDFAEGSCLVSFGRTRVVCSASLEERPPPWLAGTGRGWVTAEYAMLPRATTERTRRESTRGRPSGRSQEIQRLIGRSLRAAVDLERMKDVSIIVDCDCLVADGGTRTAAITGGFVALHDALTHLVEAGRLSSLPVVDHVAAVSVGVIGGTVLLDLPYEEDVRADVDMNVVMTGAAEFVEVQGTAEHQAFGRSALDEMLDVASRGISALVDIQRAVLSE